MHFTGVHGERDAFEDFFAVDGGAEVVYLEDIW